MLRTYGRISIMETHAMRKMLRAVVLGMFLVVSALALSASPANAATNATCGTNYYLRYPAEYVRVTKSTAAAVHTGPYGSCYVSSHVRSGAYVPAICYVINNYNNKWTYVGDGGSGGWIWNAYLAPLGSTPRC